MTALFLMLKSFRSIVMSVSVCLPVHERISETTCPNLTKFSVVDSGGLPSVPFRRSCDTLRTSGFVDYVMFLLCSR